MYSIPERKRGRPLPISIVGYEKTTIDATPKIVDENLLSVNPMDSLGAGLSTSRPSTPLPRSQSSRGKKSDD